MHALGQNNKPGFIFNTNVVSSRLDYVYSVNWSGSKFLLLVSRCLFIILYYIILFIYFNFNIYLATRLKQVFNRVYYIIQANKSKSHFIILIYFDILLNFNVFFI